MSEKGPTCAGRRHALVNGGGERVCEGVKEGSGGGKRGKIDWRERACSPPDSAHWSKNVERLIKGVGGTEQARPGRRRASGARSKETWWTIRRREERLRVSW